MKVAGLHKVEINRHLMCAHFIDKAEVALFCRAVFRPAQTEREAPAPQIAARSRLREFSDAEAIVLMYRDNPS